MKVLVEYLREYKPPRGCGIRLHKNIEHKVFEASDSYDLLNQFSTFNEMTSRMQNGGWGIRAQKMLWYLPESGVKHW